MSGRSALQRQPIAAEFPLAGANHARWPRRLLALLALCAVLTGCAVPVPLRETGAAGTIVVDTIEIEAQPRVAHWYLPAADATALVVFEHGFTRRCANLRETTRQWMASGLMALCVDAPMAGGNPALAEALARRLAGDTVAPDGRKMPGSIIVAGHSAGAVFAVALGARLDAIAPGRLAGALLFDPVATAGFESPLRAVSAAGRRPVLALLAPPHRCNAESNALPALRRAEQEARDGGSTAFVVVRLAEGATHADVEGENADSLAEWACGPVQPARTAALRALAMEWLRGVTAVDGGGNGVGKDVGKGARLAEDDLAGPVQGRAGQRGLVEVRAAVRASSRLL